MVLLYTAGFASKASNHGADVLVHHLVKVSVEIDVVQLLVGVERPGPVHQDPSPAANSRRVSAWAVGL